MYCNCIGSGNEPDEAKVEDKDIHAVKQSPKVAQKNFPNGNYKTTIYGNDFTFPVFSFSLSSVC